ncbi:MAG TPA: FAD-binding oxidoreductase [Thermoanaerobaculia bacterium]
MTTYGSNHESWGRWVRSKPARVIDVQWSSELPRVDDLVLPYGLGRSYGDVCLNNGHTLLDVSRLNRIRHFDVEQGILDIEAGASLDEILRLIVPRGWFLPVTPGTKFVTVGGCIANDVHGKNHHRAGTFGCHVSSFQLVRSDGTRLRCSAGENPELFAATIGGLGLTGLIVSAELRLRKIESSAIVAEREPFRSLEEFDRLSRDCDASHEFTVAWFDSSSGRNSKGIFFRGNHAGAEAGAPVVTRRRARRLPIAPFSPFFGPVAVRLFNTAYFRANARGEPRLADYDPFFYPLDAVANWNRIYGANGFVQYQFLIPDGAGLEPVAEILDRAARSRRASFLTVIKRFGSVPSPGLLSFPRAGLTVALDFSTRRSDALLPLLELFDDIVEAAGGSVYPAKDARMSASRFQRFFPQWVEMKKHVDPGYSSSFWRRVTG